jgi:hypothetical protein
MLVYCSRLVVRESGPPKALLTAVADWLSRKSGRTITEDTLVDGFSIRDGDRFAIECAACETSGDSRFGIQFRHPDIDYPGREWITDIGGKSDGDTWRCSVTLGTSETSRYVPPVEQTTRPKVVRSIIERCIIDSSTVGVSTRPLTLDDTDAFEYQINDPDRSFPLVVVSCDRTGKFLVDPYRLTSLLTGIAEVVFIPPEVDTYRLGHLLTPAYSAYGGAVSIIWHRDRSHSTRLHTSKLIPETLLGMRASNKDLESELLAKICHRCNPANSRSSITFETVRRFAAQARLQAALSKGEPDTELLALYENQEREQEAEIEALKRKLEETSDELTRVKDECEDLTQHNRALIQSFAAERQEKVGSGTGQGVTPSRVLQLLSERLTLERCLDAIEALFPERVVVLASARSSARESAEFNNPYKALELMAKLCDDYWSALVEGSDQDAKMVLGNSYAPNESETVRNNKRARDLRSFEYKGQQVEMMKHLKIGNKESVAMTWRLHFHWDSEDRKIVIGHCGKHLDHS